MFENSSWYAAANQNICLLHLMFLVSRVVLFSMSAVWLWLYWRSCVVVPMLHHRFVIGSQTGTPNCTKLMNMYHSMFYFRYILYLFELLKKNQQNLKFGAYAGFCVLYIYCNITQDRAHHICMCGQIQSLFYVGIVCIRASTHTQYIRFSLISLYNSI